MRLMAESGVWVLCGCEWEKSLLLVSHTPQEGKRLPMSCVQAEEQRALTESCNTHNSRSWKERGIQGRKKRIIEDKKNQQASVQ